MNDSDTPERTDEQQQPQSPQPSQSTSPTPSSSHSLHREAPPRFLFSKLASLLISGALYAGMLLLIHIVGCPAMFRSQSETNKFMSVKFVEPVPKTLSKEKHEGSDPSKKPDPTVAEFIRPIPEPAETTEINKDEPEKTPSGESVKPKNIIAPGTRGAGGVGIIGDRSKAGRQDGVRLRGGSGASENAVNAALRWLAAHQDKDGKWDHINFTRHCPSGDSCGGRGSFKHGSLPGGSNIGVTGLAFLAFLGAGNTPVEGDYQEQAGKALKWLLSVQNKRTGAFNAGRRHTSIYNHAIATLAVAECYAMTDDPKLRIRVVRAVGFLNQCQQRGGGWDYREIRTNRNDTSVTGWVVMAYKSARSAGINIPNRTISGIDRHFDRVTNKQGCTGYTSKPSGRSRQTALNAVGMLARLYLGHDRKDPLIRRQAGLLLKDLPAWGKLTGRTQRNHTMYYWYYGTLAMYQMGGQEWASWNARLRDMLVRAQCTDGHRAGSWNPEGYWARHYAGRVYSTALCTLNLEIYYRYLPLHTRSDGLGVGIALAEQIRTETDPAKRVKLLRRMLSVSHPDVDATLKNLLNDPNPTVRFTSAKELAERGDPSAIPFLIQALNHTDDFVRFGAIRALGHIEALETIEPLISALDDSLVGNAEWAAKYLRVRTGQNFGFKAELATAEKTRIMIAWKMWWENNRARLAAEPPVVARVLAARDGGAKVLLKLVTGGPIKTGMRLNVYRGGKIVGYVRISQIMEAGMAEGTTMNWMLRKPIRVGDQLKNLAAVNAMEETET